MISEHTNTSAAGRARQEGKAMSYPTIANPRRAQALRQAREARMAAARAMDYLALKRALEVAFDRWAAATPAAANAAETEYRALVQQTRELMSR